MTLRLASRIAVRSLLAAFLLCAPIYAAGALPLGLDIPRYHHDVWDAGKGFDAGAANAITQSRDGYLWIGTDRGLYRFDGVQFTRYHRGNTPQLKDREISSLAADDEGIWIGTSVGGLVRYRAGVFRRYTQRDGLPEMQIAKLAMVNGVLWMGTGNGVVVFEGGRFRRVFHDRIRGDVTALVPAPDGGVWIAVPGAVFLAKDSSLTEYKIAAGVEVDIYPDGQTIYAWSYGGELLELRNGRFLLAGLRPGKSGALTAMLRDRKSQMWFARPAGPLDRTLTGGTPPAFTREIDLAPEQDEFRILFQDRQGCLWASTQKGKLHRFRQRAFTTLRKSNGLTSDYIYSIYEDPRGAVWVGTADGLNRIEGSSITRFTVADGLPSDHVNTIAGAADGSLWIGGSNGLHKWAPGQTSTWTTRDGLSSNVIKAVLEDRRGRLWVGTNRSGLDVRTNGSWTHYGIGHDLPGDTVRSIVQDSRGVVWVGGGRGLARFDSNGSTVLTVRDGLAQESATALYIDERDVLWIGGAGGLSQYRNGKFTIFGPSAGITGAVEQVLVDKQGWVWMGGEDGISRVRRAELEDFANHRVAEPSVERFGIEDGLSALEASVSTHPLCAVGRNGRLWFAATKGLFTVDAPAWSALAAPPVVRIERFTVDGRDAPAGDGPRLVPGSSQFAIQYTALGLADPSKARFRYKLDGVDADWVQAGGRRVAYYNNIGPGRFQFRVKAANSQGVWDESGVTLAFSVERYFYQTWWFLLAVIGATGLLLAGWYSMHVRQMRQRERELAALVDERTRDLRSAEAEMRTAWTAAEKANGVKGEFLANMSHEIRTPMNGIMGMLELALECQPEPGISQYLRLAQDSAVALLTLLNDVLDFSKIEARMLTLESIDFDIRDTLAEALRTVAPKAEAKGVHLFCRIARDVPRFLKGDPGRLRQIVINLAGNAVKFTESGCVALSASIAGTALQVAVRDTGIGIAPEIQALIFEPFRQADNSITRRFGGTGLGLSICQQLVTSMGGGISCSSEPGRGSTFTFTVKLERSSRAEAAVEDRPDAVVLVSPSEDLRDDIGELLCAAGIEPQTFATADQAVQALLQRPDRDSVLIADTATGDLGHLVYTARESGIRVVFVTTLLRLPSARQWTPAIPSVTLPPKYSELLGAILLESSAAAAPAQASAAAPPARILVVEDNAVNQVLVSRILEKRGHELRLAANGLEALEAIAAEHARGTRFDLVLMDVQMPVMGGFEATARIRERERAWGSPRLPIFATTANALQGDREECLAAGMDGYISKPINVGELLALLSSVSRDTVNAPCG